MMFISKYEKRESKKEARTAAFRGVIFSVTFPFFNFIELALLSSHGSWIIRSIVPTLGEFQ